MTSPTNAKSAGDGRTYTDPTSDDPDREYISVTTAIKAGSPKYLDNWYKKLTAECAVNQRDQWINLPPEAAIDWVKRACDRHRDLAAHQGTEVHAHLEAVFTGQPPLFPPSPPAQPYVDAGKRFLDEWAPQVLYPEVTVYSDQHGYAGTADLFANITVPNLGYVPAVLDWKTGKNVYPDGAVQLAALRHAERIVIDGERHPMPQLQAGIIVHLRPDGTYAAHVAECGPDVFADFLAMLEVAQAMKRLNGYMGPPMRKPPPAPLAQVPAPQEPRSGTVPPTVPDLTALTDEQAEQEAYEGELRSGQDPFTIENLTVLAVSLAAEHPQFLAKLADIWPPGLPTLRQAREGHADLGPAQLEIVAELIDHAAGFFTPFPEPTEPPAPVNLTVVHREPPEPRATVEQHEEMIQRLKRLPDDLLARVQAEAVGRFPNLRTGQFTVQALAELGAIVQVAEEEQGDRFTRVCAALTKIPDAAHPTVLAEVGIPDVDRPEADALARLEAFAALPISGVA